MTLKFQYLFFLSRVGRSLLGISTASLLLCGLLGISHGQAHFDKSGAVTSFQDVFHFGYSQNHELTSIAIGTGIQPPTSDVVRLSLVSALTAEEDGVVVVRFLLSQTTDFPVSFDYETQDMTATAGDDYLSKSGSLLFAPGETVKEVTITLLDDAVWEGLEIFEINVSGLSEKVELSSASISVFVSSSEEKPVANIMEALEIKGLANLSQGGGVKKIQDFSFDSEAVYIGTGQFRDGTVLGGWNYGQVVKVSRFFPFNFSHINVGSGDQVELFDGNLYISTPEYEISNQGVKNARGRVNVTDLNGEEVIGYHNRKASIGFYSFGANLKVKDGFSMVHSDGWPGPHSLHVYDERLDEEFFEYVSESSSEGLVKGFDIANNKLFLSVSYSSQHRKMNRVSCIDPSNGSDVWSFESGERGHFANSLAVAGQTLVMQGGGNGYSFHDSGNGSYLFSESEGVFSTLFVSHLKSFGDLILVPFADGLGVFDGVRREWYGKCTPLSGELNPLDKFDLYRDEIAILDEQGNATFFDLGLNELGPFVPEVGFREGGAEPLRVKISGVPEGRETWNIRYEIEGGTATLSEDFTAPPFGVLNFTSADMSGVLPVSFVDDVLLEGDEGFTIRFFDSDTGLELSVVRVTIRDDDQEVEVVERVKGHRNGGGGAIALEGTRLGYGVAGNEDFLLTSSGSAIDGDIGAVYVFRKSDMTLHAGLQTANQEQYGMGFSLAIDDDYFYVGGPKYSRGAVTQYVGGSRRTGFSSPIFRDGDEFGSSIVALGKENLIGAPGAIDGKGAVRVFSQGGYLRTITLPLENEGTRFGELLCGRGQRAYSKVTKGQSTHIVGFSPEDGSVSFDHKVYLTSPGPYRVSSMACDDDWLVAGSLVGGEVLVFDAKAGTFLKNLKPVKATHAFGTAVAVFDGVVAVRGSRSPDGNPAAAYGVVVLFDLESGNQIGEVLEEGFVTGHIGSGPQGLHFDEDGVFVGWMYQTDDALQSGVVEKVVLEQVRGLVDLEVKAVPHFGGVAEGLGVYRKGENFSFSAHAAQGFNFLGWYSEGGDLLSSEINFEGVVSVDSELEARFTPSSYPSGYTDWILTQIGHGVTRVEFDGEFDFDGDGRSNLAEFFEGTSAADASSRFEFVISKVDYTDQEIRLECDSVEGFDYWVEWSPNLVDWYLAVGEGETSLGTGEELEFRVSRGDETRRYYRIASSHELDLVEF